jgi:hypothetical protein
MRQTILTVLLATASSVWATPVKIHGYITSLASPTAFAVDDYRITRDDSLAFDLDKGDYPDATFRPEDLRVGTELDIAGEFNETTHELKATGIKVFLSDNLRVKRSVVVENGAVLQREGYGWKGVIHADGQTIKVDGQTKLSLKENQTNQITPGLSISYEGRRERDGSILATKLQIFPNDTGRSEQKLFREIAPKLNSNGEIGIHGTKYKLVPDAEAQSYVQRIGAKLVPITVQQDLSGGAARRLQFQFYLIENPDFNAHAFPNGIVLVNSGVFRVLTSEAQFAAVLGHEIAHATQEHAFRESQHQKKTGAEALREKGYAGAKGDSLGNGYSRSLENQADRIGLEYMVNAGYDAREAAEVWKQVARTAGHQKAGFLWNGDTDTTSRRSYLMAELATNYAGINFQSYERTGEDFSRLAERFGNTAVAQRAPEPPAIKSAAAKSAPEQLRPGFIGPTSTPQNSGPVTGAPAPSQEQRYGSNAVTITSDPAGADVVLNGRVIGTTPMTLPTGSVGIPFIITVQKTGYRGWTGQLVSVPGRTSLRVELLPGR